MRAARFGPVPRENDIRGEDNEREVRERVARLLSRLRYERLHGLGLREAAPGAAELDELVGEQITKRFPGAANSRIEKRLLEVTDTLGQFCGAHDLLPLPTDRGPAAANSADL